MLQQLGVDVAAEGAELADDLDRILVRADRSAFELGCDVGAERVRE